MSAGKRRVKVPPQVQTLAAKTVKGVKPPPPPTPPTARRTLAREKVVAALKRLHPMD